LKNEVRVRAGRKAHRKGKAGEYGVRDLLRTAFYPNGEGTVERTPMSGAWHALPVLSGDLIFIVNGMPDYTFPFFWEVKSYDKKKFSPYEMMQGNVAVLGKWLDVAYSKCALGGPVIFPIIVWKATGFPWFVFFDMTSFDLMNKLLPLDKSTVTMLCVQEGWIIMCLEEFLLWVRNLKVEVHLGK